MSQIVAWNSSSEEKCVLHEELQHCTLARYCSITGFCGGIHNAHHESQMSPRSLLSALWLFISIDELFRVGGRLAKASLSFSEKDSILLAKNSHLSLLLVRCTHSYYTASNPKLFRYWIVHPIFWSFTRSKIKQCVQ